MSHPRVLTSFEEFRSCVAESPEPVMVEFTAAWCAPCRSLAPVLADLARRYDGRVRVAVVDVEALPAVSQACRVTSMPTLLGFAAGQPIVQRVGYSGRAPVERLFEELEELAGQRRSAEAITARSPG